MNRADLLRLMTQALYHTPKTHTVMVLGQERLLTAGGHIPGATGYQIKVICESTGAVVTLQSDLRGNPVPPYPRCRFCGFNFDKNAIDVEAELLVDTDTIDAWPALTAEFLGEAFLR